MCESVSGNKRGHGDGSTNLLPSHMNILICDAPTHPWLMLTVKAPALLSLRTSLGGYALLV